MNPIQTEVKRNRPIKYHGGNELSYYTYLKIADTRSEHISSGIITARNLRATTSSISTTIAKRMIEYGGRRDIFLGTRECQAYVVPCVLARSRLL